MWMMMPLPASAAAMKCYKTTSGRGDIRWVPREAKAPIGRETRITGDGTTRGGQMVKLVKEGKIAHYWVDARESIADDYPRSRLQ